MNTKIYRGTYGYLDRNKKNAWIKAVIMIAVPLAVFLAGLMIYKTRMNVLTVIAVLGCLPGCNQIVHAIMASRYHSIDRALYEEVEKARKDRLAVYESVLTTYEKTYFVDCFVISGRDAVGYTTDANTDVGKAAEHIRKMLKDNSYQQNVKIYRPNEKKGFLERVSALSGREEEAVPFEPDERYPNMTRSEVIRHLLTAISF